MTWDPLPLVTPIVSKSASELAELRKLVSRRIRLEFTNDNWTRLTPGDLGTITHVDDIGQLHVQWDSGSRLAMIPGVDRYIILDSDSQVEIGTT